MIGLVCFDAILIVDWSANNRPKLGRDSLWYCLHKRDGEVLTRNPATRNMAMAEITEIAISTPGRLLIGFDFPFGYPGMPWREAWREIAGLVQDAPDNTNNRFAVACEMNKRLSGGPGPFWGCPPAFACDFLTTTQPRERGLARLTDRKGAQPVWKLAYQGAPGGQSLLGIPRVRKLREDVPGAAIWPFETGLRIPSERVVIAEVYPSLIRLAGYRGEVKDQLQVRSLAAHLINSVNLPLYFAPALSEAERYRVENEEGWILGMQPAVNFTSLPQHLAYGHIHIGGR
jgi:precorrin-8X/cobalt-precorrin-8 methylmutase